MRKTVEARTVGPHASWIVKSGTCKMSVVCLGFPDSLFTDAVTYRSSAPSKARLSDDNSSFRKIPSALAAREICCNCRPSFSRFPVHAIHIYLSRKPASRKNGFFRPRGNTHITDDRSLHCSLLALLITSFSGRTSKVGRKEMQTRKHFFRQLGSHTHNKWYFT